MVEEGKLRIASTAFSNSMSPSTELVHVRPMIIGPDIPESPYPIALTGAVHKGFGRGGKDLGCPTGWSYLSHLLSSLIQLFRHSKFTRRFYLTSKFCCKNGSILRLCSDRSASGTCCKFWSGRYQGTTNGYEPWLEPILQE